MKRTPLVFIVVIGATLLLSACAQPTGSQSASSSAAPSSAASSMSSTTATAPQKEEPAASSIGAGTSTIQVLNETGYDIIGLRIKPSSQESYDAKNSFDGFVFANGETADLSFTPQAGANAYDVVLLTAEDSKIAVRNVDLLERKNITFRFEEGIGYITYTDASTGQTVDNRAEALDSEETAAIVPDDLKTQQG